MGQKLKFILSDLHIGVDRLHQQAHSTGEHFTAFLQTIQRESEQHDAEVELIINGDFLAFLQAPAVTHYDPTASYPPEAYLDSSQEASLKRLNLIIAANPAVFDALAEFLSDSRLRCKLTIIKGNHDVSLFWPKVKSRLREVLGALGSRASLVQFADEFVNREKIYVEHGHQRAESMNAYRDSFDPRTSHDPSQLHHPAGSRFTVDFLNEARQQYWFADQVKPVTALIWFALEWNFEFACRALSRFIRFTPALVVNNFDPRTSSITKMLTVLQDLDDEAHRAAMARQYRANPYYRQVFNSNVHTYTIDAMLNSRGDFEAVYPARITDDPVALGLADQQLQQAMLKYAAETVASQGNAQVIIFGHTHHASRETLANGCTYLNTGSWLPDFFTVSAETWSKLFNHHLGPEHLPRPLPYVRIEYTAEGQPCAQLLYFNSKASNGVDPTARPEKIRKISDSWPKLLRFLGVDDQ